MIEIASAGMTATVDAEAGGRLARLSWRRKSGEPVEILKPLDAATIPPHWPKGGAYPLIPYHNRIARGRLTLRGRTYRIAPHPDAYPHSLHGHAHLERWACTASGPAHAEIAVTCGRSAAWPWAFEARQLFAVERDRIVVSLSLRNVDDAPMPAGLGWHPYLVTSASAKLLFDAKEVWPHASDYLPQGSPRPFGDGLRTSLSIGEAGLTAYFGRWDGRADIRYDGGLRLALLADDIFDQLVVHQPAHHAYLCLEPVTHVANGFNLAESGLQGTGLRILEPGAELKGSVRVILSEEDTPG